MVMRDVVVKYPSFIHASELERESEASILAQVDFDPLGAMIQKSHVLHSLPQHSIIHSTNDVQNKLSSSSMSNSSNAWGMYLSRIADLS